MLRRKFSREYKLEAVRLVRERGVGVAQASRHLDVHESVLRKWVRDLPFMLALLVPAPKFSRKTPAINGPPFLGVPSIPANGLMRRSQTSMQKPASSKTYSLGRDHNFTMI